MSISRRRFLQGTAAAAGVTVLNFTSMPAYAHLFNDCNDGRYKALIGIDFAGGNDGFNMIIPQSDSVYTNYQRLRGNLQIGKGDGENLTNEFNLNPALDAMAELWNKNELLPILNVGPLIVPRGESGLTDELKPAHLFSHNHQSAMVQTSSRVSLDKQGFGANGEIALGSTSRGFEGYSPLFDIGGGQEWTNNLNMQSNKVGSSAPHDIFINNESNRDKRLFERIQQQNNYQHVFQRHYAKLAANAPDTHGKMSDIFNTVLDASIVFPETAIGRQLEAVVKLILNQEAFGQQRQYFSCKLGGFDTHSNQLAQQSQLLMEYSEAITVFHQALRLYKLDSQVTSFTHSEFGRTLIPNANGGSDHGWGSHSFVIGGAVSGKRFVGAYPSLEEGSDHLLSRGRVIPTTSTDQVHATLLSWLGLRNEDITNIFPALESDEFTEKTLDIFSCV
ncbi:MULTISPECIES: DUF1501 domain-containing protein [Vibrio]|uniref:Uncharacterized protein n=1 Tax=Vibrio celticus TaxID=446372 RepID=A0A1C3JJW9_9VIBR|nr:MULTISPECIES: DUF1501 domain-containing protein [Vibrio]MCK8085950.1 DUF1501 domain-containing protein [Vibrio sp. 1CM8B]SBT15397.1 hypothetical protein VCE7224_04186 [Vibrio celticus]